MIKTISIITLFFIFALPLQAGAQEPLVLVQSTPQGMPTPFELFPRRCNVVWLA